MSIDRSEVSRAVAKAIAYKACGKDAEGATATMEATMSDTYSVEYTDTFGGEANYCWVKRATIVVPELTHYGCDGQLGYARANRIAKRELMKAAKAAVGLTGVRGRRDDYGDTLEFRPFGSCTVMFVTYQD